jgi:hypothetical protein
MCTGNRLIYTIDGASSAVTKFGMIFFRDSSVIARALLRSLFQPNREVSELRDVSA